MRALLVVPLLLLPMVSTAAAPKGACSLDGKPLTLARNLEEVVIAVVTVAGESYGVMRPTKGATATKLVALPNGTKDVPVGGAGLNAVPDGTLTQIGLLASGVTPNLNPAAWTGVGANLMAVDADPKGGIRVATWALPNPAPVVLYLGGDEVIHGPFVATTSCNRVAVTWSELAADWTSQSRLVLLDANGNSVADAITLVANMKGRSANSRVAAYKDGFLALWSEGQTEKHKPILKWQRFSGTGKPASEALQVDASWDGISAPYVTCGPKVYAALREVIGSRLVAHAIDPEAGDSSASTVVLPDAKAMRIGEEPTITCVGETPVVGWTEFQMRPGPQSVVVAAASTTPVPKVVKKKAGQERLDPMGSTKVVNAKGGLFVVWSEPHRGPAATKFNNDQQVDVLAQRLACGDGVTAAANATAMPTPEQLREVKACFDNVQLRWPAFARLSVLKDSITEKSLALERLRQFYGDVAAHSAPEEAACAVTTVGLAERSFADALRGVKPPADLPPKNLPLLREKLEGDARPHDEEARAKFAKVVGDGSGLGSSPCRAQAATLLRAPPPAPGQKQAVPPPTKGPPPPPAPKASEEAADPL